jgi:hypothetical protein
MPKYLLLKHYRGGPAPAVDWAPMDQWTPDEVDAHVQFMRDFAARLEATGEFIDTQALAPDGAFVRYDGEGRPPTGRSSRPRTCSPGGTSSTWPRLAPRHRSDQSTRKRNAMSGTRTSTPRVTRRRAPWGGRPRSAPQTSGVTATSEDVHPSPQADHSTTIR